MRYFDLSEVNRSVATFSQGLLGNWEGIIGSFAFCFWCCWHILHLAIFSWISELIPGHYNTSRAHGLDFSMPMWPWWILSNISFRIEVGIRILSPLRMIPFSSDIQSLTSQYMPVLLLRQASVPGHPRLMISLRCVSDSSLAVSSRFSSSLGFASGRLDCIRWPWSAFFPLPCCYHSVVSGIDSQDSMSGSNNSLPAYILVCSRTFAFWAEFFIVWVVLSIRASSEFFLGVCDLILRALSFRTCIGWTAAGWTQLPRVPFLSVHFLIQPQVKILMRKPRDNRSKTPLRPAGEASQLTVTGFCTSKNFRTGPPFSVKTLLIYWKALTCWCDHWNSMSFCRSTTMGSVTDARLGMNFPR